MTRSCSLFTYISQPRVGIVGLVKYSHNAIVMLIQHFPFPCLYVLTIVASKVSIIVALAIVGFIVGTDKNMLDNGTYMSTVISC